MTGIENTAEYIPLGIAVVTGLSGFGVALAQYVWSKRAVPPPPDIKPNTPVSKEYEKTMAVMMGRIAGTLEAQTIAMREHVEAMKQQAAAVNKIQWLLEQLASSDRRSK